MNLLQIIMEHLDIISESSRIGGRHLELYTSAHHVRGFYYSFVAVPVPENICSAVRIVSTSWDTQFRFSSRHIRSSRLRTLIVWNDGIIITTIFQAYGDIMRFLILYSSSIAQRIVSTNSVSPHTARKIFIYLLTFTYNNMDSQNG